MRRFGLTDNGACVMPYNTRTVRNAIVSILTANNTTTSSYDVSSGLATRVKLIQHGSDNTPVPNTQYPAILVLPVGKSEEGDEIGRSQRRQVESEFDIFGLTMRSDSGENADNESLILSDNIENCLKQYIDLSATVDWSNIDSTKWTIGDDDQVFVNIGTIRLTTRSFAR